MFDRVWVTCPSCGNNIEFQSKAGACELKDYSLDTAPSEIAGSILGDQYECEHCHRDVKIIGKVVAFAILI
jgi:predicted RNA-binding Zn-ribbon protein involved in translation (DUF1610 family)